MGIVTHCTCFEYRPWQIAVRCLRVSDRTAPALGETWTPTLCRTEQVPLPGELREARGAPKFCCG
jgi:hypothetical protein